MHVPSFFLKESSQSSVRKDAYFRDPPYPELIEPCRSCRIARGTWKFRGGMNRALDRLLAISSIHCVLE